MDKTRFDVEVCGKKHEPLSKRRAFPRVVKALVQQFDHSPEKILSKVTDEPQCYFVSVQGHLDEEAFKKAVPSEGKKFKGWLRNDAELIRHDGRTYALRSLYGKDWEAAMQALAESCPSANVRFYPTGLGD